MGWRFQGSRRILNCSDSLHKHADPIGIAPIIDSIRKSFRRHILCQIYLDIVAVGLSYCNHLSDF